MRLGLGMGFVKNRKNSIRNRYWTYFNGIDEYASISKPNSLLNLSNGKASFSLWTKPLDTSGSGHHTMFCLYADDDNRLYFDNPKGSYLWGLIVIKGNATLISFTSSYDASVIKHFVFTIENNILKVYINGKLDNTKILADTLINWTGDGHLRIASYEKTAYIYKGYINNFGMWNGKVLGQTDIAKLYANGKIKSSPSPSSIVGLTCGYRLGENAYINGSNVIFPNLTGNTGLDLIAQGMDMSNIGRI